MTSQILLDAQRYLTVNDGMRERKLLDLVALSDNHDPDELIMLMCELYYEKHQCLSRLLDQDDNSIMVDHVIGSMFRLSSAIRLIKDIEKEETVYETERRTGTGG